MIQKIMKTILVIEDNMLQREITCEFLKTEGYNVLSAEDGLMGLQKTVSCLPDLILCDIIMPVMNGFDFYKSIQQRQSTSCIPLIFVTAQSEDEDIRAAMNMGVDDYITKPVDFKALLSSIKIQLAKAERKQQERDQNLFSIVDNSLTGGFIYRKNKFDFVNEKCAKIFGLHPTDFSDMNFHDLIAGSDKDSVLNEIEQCFSKAQKSLHIHFPARCNEEKHEVVVELFATIVNYKGVDSLVGYMSE
jgi:PAS domain S-box-containing protein